MWDPDAVSPAYIHMLIVNIPDKRVRNGAAILPYTPPAPPAGTGTHRYITGLFRQSQPISIKPMKRDKFNVGKFIRDYGLELVDKRVFTLKS